MASATRVMQITQSQWIAQPWKNGGGVTHEIVRLSDNEEKIASAATPFALRLSVAQLDGAQPFSIFPGTSRTLIPLDHNTLNICINGVTSAMTKHRQFDFAGDVAAGTTGPGKARDFNVMSRPPRPHRAMIGQSPLPDDPPQSQRAIFALQAGHVWLDAMPIVVGQFDTLVIHRGEPAMMKSDQPMVWIHW